MSYETYWLDMKVAIGKDNPMLAIKEKYGTKISRVTPNLYPNGDQHLVDISLKSRNDLSNLKKEIRDGKYGNTIQNILLSDRDHTVSFWVESPSFELIKEVMFVGYDILENPLQEHFFVCHPSKNILLEKILQKAFEKVGRETKNLDWCISKKMVRGSYPSLTLLENYKYRSALYNDFFRKHDEKSIVPLFDELRKVGYKVSMEELKRELKEEIEKKVFEDLVSHFSEKNS